MSETENITQPWCREYQFTAIEHKLLADFEAEAQSINTQAQRAIADLKQRSFGALQLILAQHGMTDGEWEVTEGLAGVRRKPKPGEPPKE